MEDLEASVTELLVATNVKICQSVYQHLQPVHEDKKPIWHLPIGKLHLLSVPNTRWETISINFTVELPEFDSVMAIVDPVSKTVYFIPTHTMVSMEGVVRLFPTWRWHPLTTGPFLGLEHYVMWGTSLLTYQVTRPDKPCPYWWDDSVNIR